MRGAAVAAVAVVAIAAGAVVGRALPGRTGTPAPPAAAAAPVPALGPALVPAGPPGSTVRIGTGVGHYPVSPCAGDVDALMLRRVSAYHAVWWRRGPGDGVAHEFIARARTAGAAESYARGLAAQLSGCDLGLGDSSYGHGHRAGLGPQAWLSWVPAYDGTMDLHAAHGRQDGGVAVIRSGVLFATVVTVHGVSTAQLRTLAQAAAERLSAAVRAG